VAQKEPIPLEVISFQKDFQELYVDIFKDAAETDDSLFAESAARQQVEVLRGETSIDNVLGGGSTGNPDYYIYDKGDYNESYAVPQAKNLFGANLDVVATLGDEDNIQFEAMGDSSLRNAIAYIVPWQRASSSSRTQSASSAVNAPRTNFFQGVIDGLSPDFGFAEPGYFDSILDGIDTSFVPSWDEINSSWDANIDYFNTDLDFFVGDDFKGNLNSEYYTKILNTDTEDQATLDQSAAEKRQAAVSSEVPMGWRQGILAGGRFLAGELIEDTGIRGLVDTALTQGAGLLNTPTGPVYIGNANGLVNQVLDIATIFGVNVPRGLTTSIPPNLQSKRSKLEGFAAKAKPTNGMWQFLFNPSEIALSAGPKFKTTETWGVSDEANSGQPLHWTNNKNTTLQFSKVLLNGYIFGKKVESLEQGLFKLFLENPTNDAKHGPKVLEFVWGKRSFGPCVIKDIRVNEKMWDEGCLVSADVSFTLEKVPEWTINDGQVSTFDPTAHPVSALPTKTTPSEAKQPNAEDKPQPPTSPEKENKPAVRCLELRNAQLNAVRILDKTFEAAAENKTPKLSRFTSIVVVQNRIKFISDNTKNVIASYNKFLNSVTKADPSIYNTKCAREVFGQQYGELISISNNNIYNAYTDTIEKSDKIFSGIRACSNDLRKVLKAKSDAGKCGATGGGNAGGAQSIDPNAPAYIPPGT